MHHRERAQSVLRFLVRLPQAILLAHTPLTRGTNLWNKPVSLCLENVYTLLFNSNIVCCLCSSKSIPVWDKSCSLMILRLICGLLVRIYIVDVMPQGYKHIADC